MEVDYTILEEQKRKKEEKEEEKEEVKEEEKRNDEKREKDLVNNMKAVFIGSGSQGKEFESINGADYVLNFYRNGNDLRQYYLQKLIVSKIYMPNMELKKYNSIIIFEWDETLFPTSFLTPFRILDEHMNLSDNEKNKLLELEQATLKILSKSVERGDAFIITNAINGWVENSAHRFYPNIIQILEKIKIIYAKEEYEKIFPGNQKKCKIEAFSNLQNKYNRKLVTNIICIGNSLFEMEAGRILASKFNNAFIKSIKFKKKPKLDELLTQLKSLGDQFDSIHSFIKNISISY